MSEVFFYKKCYKGQIILRFTFTKKFVSNNLFNFVNFWSISGFFHCSSKIKSCLYIKSIIVYGLFGTVYLCKKVYPNVTLQPAYVLSVTLILSLTSYSPLLYTLKKVHCQLVKCKALIICSINGYGWDLNEFSVTAGNKSLQLNSIDETFTTFIASL